MFKLAGGDYYHVPAAQVQQICPGLRPMIDQAVQNGTVRLNSVNTLSLDIPS